MFRGQVTGASEKGQRLYQEDRFLALAPELFGNFSGWLLAIMDGHNGSEVSEFCFKNLPDIFSRISNNGKLKVDEVMLKKIIRLLAKETSQMSSGSTISLAYIDEVALVARVAILGDSPVLVKDFTGKIIISPEHNVRTNLTEREAAIKKGAFYDPRGYVSNSKGYTQLSRSLGDQIFSDFISREPEIYSVKLGPESFVLVASDGVLDPSHGDSQSLMESIVGQIEKGATAEELVDNAIFTRRIEDNATAVLWRVPK
ncbi:MAG: hypothetical protein A3I24_03645 [Candidatus Harrisonbacteria bacterium RIFCSPLOWO2_02_FULL_41_13b]|uniref:protein-serine/threonine phosphatase n=1 Tax=Candidatus Harrisonbacteria bacterium RIFCSPLOWO2_02_FULL_41_13b TaxID=1798409 RepID=A0A1G1ZT64_9BACT|nr:MAG: hypothetical protein A3I24_03645 [Candidatus Harrisonbacteria bacterium RIFCSPLOWO2_02_FULL_41_13b]